ncbi:type VII secretion target [Nocardia flavorosea]|uniref:ESX-1 secretion-associated protein n=1 Tax=Nocardia flavorosea TaxID=53429 RepID=A0A846YQ30_9NOCA|nr:type VII secretion target [Nocardia flavorosea]NKY59821.1 ESX-1 secretion-associated protein [Nocardia flavorosea]
MPDRLEIDPAILRQLAGQHEQVARETREWAKPPVEWLANFEPTYGKIANPVKVALERYYDARQRAGEALAREHDQTAESLLKAAESYERADAESAASIGRNEESFTGVPAGTPAPSVVPPSGTNSVPGPIGGALGGLSGAPVAGVGAAPEQSAPAAQTGPAAPGAPISAPAASAGAGANSGTNGAASAGGPPAGPTAPSGGLPPLGSAGLPLGAVGAGAAGAEERPADQRQSGTAAPGAMPVPVVPTPFGAAVAAAKNKAAEPDYVVGEEVSEDLVIARTLLGAVLAAVEPSVGMAWAVSVMRGPGGAGIFITSNEGRGWMPAGLYLPREVSTPWLWDELLGATESPGSPWEGVADPARVLVEFGLAWGAKANAELSALVSSGPIDPGLRAHLAQVPMEGMVRPAYDVDLRVFTPDTVDRLGLAGSVSALDSVAALPDSRVRAHCLELALDAQSQLVRSVAPPPEIGGVRSLRDRILARLQSGGEVPREWWNDLQEADDLVAAAMISHRVDVGRVGLGDLRVDDEATALRTMAWERRCNELVFLLNNDDSRQLLRDSVYVHEQIVRHPSFVAAPPAVSVDEEQRIHTVPTAGGTEAEMPEPIPATVSPTQVSAPPAVSGPPKNAVAPPVVPPAGVERN